MKKLASIAFISYLVSSAFIGYFSILILNTVMPVSTIYWGMMWYFTPTGFLAVTGMIMLISLINAILIYLMVK
jgi:hypothetical protein